MNRRTLLAALLAAPLTTFSAIAAHEVLAQPERITGSRWLRVDALSGYVEFKPVRSAWRQAILGNFLSNAGDQLQTGQNSAASLTMDSSIGRLRVGGSTSLGVRSLSITASGGRVTRLNLTRGQVRTYVRPFTNRSSRLQIHTPAGVSGVRGTDYGVAVGEDDGKTAIATLRGQVVATAQGVTVAVDEGFLTTIVPGEPPSPPVRFNNRASFEKVYVDLRRGRGRLVGRTEVGNLVEVLGISQKVADDGIFEATIRRVPRWSNGVEVRITTPLGNQKTYSVAAP